MSPDKSQPDTVPFTDERLLAAYRRGCEEDADPAAKAAGEEAAKVLFQRYYPRLMGLARKQMGWMLCQVEDSADVALSVFRSVFIRGRGHQIELDPESSLWPLMATITINKIRNRVKFHGCEKRPSPDKRVPLQDHDPLEIGPTPEDAMQLQELIEQIRELFGGRRAVILDYLLQGFSVAEIAEETGAAERTVYKTRAAVRQVLEQMLADR